MIKSYVTYIILLLITLSFFSCKSDNPLIPPLTNDTKPVWPQVGYNGRHTNNRYGINVNIPPVQTGNVYWMDSTTHAYVNDGSEAACDAAGNFYFRYSETAGGKKGKVIKYRPDGTRIWERDSLQNDAYMGFALSYDETRIYYSDWYKFVCRDSSGKFVWSLPNGSNAGVIPCIAKDGTIYTVFGSDLTAVTPDGIVKWRLYDTDVFLPCWPVLDRDGNICIGNVISQGQYELLKIDKNGNILYRYRLNDWILSVVIDGYNNIYFRDSQKLYSLNEKFDLRWEKEIPGNNYIHVVPAITKENHIIIDSVYSVISIDNTGKTDWVNTFPNSGLIEPYIILDDEDNVYFNYWNNNLDFSVCSLDKNGNLRWNNIQPVLGNILPGLTLSP